jgi:hypothetical protein
MKHQELIKLCLHETCSRAGVGKHLSDTFAIKKVLKEGDFLSPLLLNFALEYVIRRVPAQEEGLKLNDTHKFMVCANDVNKLGGTQKLF